MSSDSNQSQYVVHFENGATAGPIDCATVQAMIEVGSISTRDHISKDGSSPIEFYLLDEFVELWDPDTSELHSLPSDPTEPSSADEDEDTSDTLETDVVVSNNASQLGIPPRPQLGVKSSVSDEPKPPAMPVLGESMPPSGPDSDAAPLMPILGEQKGPAETGSSPALDDPLSADDPIFSDATRAVYDPASSSGAPFHGFDPISDSHIDPVTILDLLYDSSLYTVLALPANSGPADLQRAYLNRVELIAARQRQSDTSDPEQIIAMESVRHLVFLSHSVLADPEKRKEYDTARDSSGLYVSAAEYLGLTTSDEDRLPDDSSLPDEIATGDHVSTESSSMSALIDDVIDSVDEGRPSQPSSGEDSLLASLSSGGLSAKVFEATDTGSEPALESKEGVRLWANPLDTIKNKPPGAVRSLEETLSGPLPSVTRSAEAARAKIREEEKRSSPTGRTTMPVMFSDGEDRFPEGLRWAFGKVNPAKGLLHVSALFIPLVLLCLGVIIGTDMGVRELHYGSPSAWFFIRCGVLVIFALIGTLAIRRESLLRLLGDPAPQGILAAVAIGFVLGMIGGYVSPIRIEGEFSLGLVCVFFLVQAIGHETFFRGYVTRVLLVELPHQMVAWFLSCTLYGVFYMTFYDVTQISGFYFFYYSMFLFGFGMGGVFTLLYWRTRSIFATILAHFVAFFVSLVFAV